MSIRPLGDMLTEMAGSLLSLGIDQSLVRATSVELTLPINVEVGRSTEDLIFYGDVPAWRWRTVWDRPFGQLRLKLEERRQELEE